MGGFLTRERFGRPQVMAALLLLAFLAQCLWLVERGWRGGTVDPEEIYRLERGTALWKHRGVVAGPPDLAPDLGKELNPTLRSFPSASEGNNHDQNHSPLWYLVAAAPLLVWPVQLQAENIRELHWLAAAPYICFRSVARGIAVVRFAAAFRQRRRIRCAGSLLLFAGDCALQRALVCRARGRSSLGSLRRDLHRHRRSPHVVCATGSDPVELAAHCAPGIISRARRRVAVCADRGGAGRAGVHALSCSHPPPGDSRDLGGGLWNRRAAFICRLFFPRGRVLARDDACVVLWNLMASLHHGAGLPPGPGAAGTKQPRTGGSAARSADYIFRRGRGRVTSATRLHCWSRFCS